jgi:hypothetical protein
MNKQNISDGKYEMNQIIKPVILTLVITLILYLFYGCEDRTEITNKTYKIINKYDSSGPNIPGPSNIPIPNTIPNQNLDKSIFIPQHKAMKMGLNI